MPICPECEENIDHLLVEQENTSALKVEDGKPVYDDSLLEDWQRENNYLVFACPKCHDEIHDELVTTEEEAVKFLTGELEIPIREKPVYEPTRLVSYRPRRKTDQMEMALE